MAQLSTAGDVSEIRFLSVSIDFSRFSSHWYVILFNHMTYISKYLHNCITKICIYIYILFSNSYQYHNACVKLPALLCCGHGHVSSSSLLQRTASAGRTFVDRMTEPIGQTSQIFCSREAPSSTAPVARKVVTACEVPNLKHQNSWSKNHRIE